MTNLLNQVVHVPTYMLLNDPTTVDADELHPVLVIQDFGNGDCAVAPIRKLENVKTISSDFFTYSLPVIIDEEHQTQLDDEDLIDAIIEAANESPCAVDPIADVEAFKALPRAEQISLQTSFVAPMEF